MEWEFEINNILPNEVGPATQQDVITLCDYETCPTIKSNKAINTIIVVKPDGNLHPIEAGRNHSDHNHYEPLENRQVGSPPQ
jgi:hypothetical protein